jgi:tetratricopeptide (TPR) repeat protein
LQWYGYEERGNKMIESSIQALEKTKSIPAAMYHSYSVQNTKNGNFDQAIFYLEKAAQLDSIEVDGYYGWVLLYYYRDYKKALWHFDRLLRAKKSVTYVGDDNIFYAMGLCHKQLKKYKKALELFNMAIDYELKEHNEKWITAQMYFQKARTLHLLGSQKEAIVNYDKAIKVWEGSAESIFYKGVAEIELGLSSGCPNLQLALEKVKKGTKSSDLYVRLFDEIYEVQVEEMIRLKCSKL